LDVLSKNDFGACGAPGEVSMPGGLSWPELAAMTSSAMRAGRVCGWSLGVYNPDVDPEGRDAQRIVSFVADVTSNWT
jgi:arginase